MNKYYYLDGQYSSRSNTIMAVVKLIYHVILISFGTVILVMAVTAYTKHIPHHHSISDFLSNWRLKPIVDLQVRTSDCPEGYENLISRYWPGTIHGCHCSNSVGLQEILTSKCTDQQIQSGCKDVYSISQLEMNKICMNVINEYNICGKREGKSFLNATRPNSQNECKSKHNTCFKGDSDYGICVKDQKECPITDIIIIEPGGELPAGYDYHQIGQGFKLAYTKTFNYLPIVKLRLTEGLVCADHNQYAKSEGRDLYKLIKKTNYGNCTKEVGRTLYDTRVDNIGSVKERNLFKDNEMINTIENLPEYPKEQADNYVWNVYKNSMYEWALNCEEMKLESGSMFDRHYIYTVTKTVTEAQSRQVSLVILCTIYLLICGVVLGGLNIFLSIKTICNSDFIDKNRSFLFGVYIATIIVSWGFYISMIIIYSLSISTIEDYREAFQLMSDEKCSDEMTNNILDSYEDSLLDLKSRNVSGFTFTILSMSLNFLYICGNLILYGIKIYRSR